VEDDWACSTDGEKRNVCRLSVGTPEGKRALGIPRHRRLENIKIDLGEMCESARCSDVSCRSHRLRVASDHVRPCRCLKENWSCSSLRVAKETLVFRRTQVKTLLATIHVAFVGCHGNLVYRVVSWIPVLANLWEVPWKAPTVCNHGKVLVLGTCLLTQLSEG
jgi:hypothetical protein